MRIIDGFVLRSVAGEMIISGEGVAQINFNKLISLNESAAYLWRSVEGVDFTVETLASLLEQRYEIDRELAMTDATAIMQSWVDVKVVK